MELGALSTHVSWANTHSHITCPSLDWDSINSWGHNLASPCVIYQPTDAYHQTLLTFKWYHSDYAWFLFAVHEKTCHWLLSYHRIKKEEFFPPVVDCPYYFETRCSSTGYLNHQLLCGDHPCGERAYAKAIAVTLLSEARQCVDLQTGTKMVIFSRAAQDA